MGTRLATAAGNIITTIVRLFRWWFRQIGQQTTIRAKAVVVCAGLLALCTVCSLPVAFVNGPKKPAPAVATVPSARPTTVEADAPIALPSVAPSSTVVPSPTAVPATVMPEPTITPTDIPTAEPSATPVPTTKPKPTTAPAPAQAIAITDPNAHSFNGGTVDPPWWPCAKGQIKGSQNKKYHRPTGQFYAKTYENVTCFNTATEAEAAGFVASKR